MTEIIESRGGDISLLHADSITCPALLIAGEHDPFVPPPLLRQLAARIPNARQIEVEGAGHDLHMSHPDQLITTVVDWLKQSERTFFNLIFPQDLGKLRTPAAARDGLR